MDAAPPVARCQSCGGSSADGDLCKSCRQAFAPVLSSTPVAEPSVDKTPEVALPPPPPVVPVINVDAAQTEAAKAERAKAAADLTVKAHLARAANPAPVVRRPVVAAAPPQAQTRSRTPMLLTAAAVLVVVIGATEGARRYGFLLPTQTAREEQPVQAPRKVETAPAPKVMAENRAPAPIAQAPAPAVAAVAVTPKSKVVVAKRGAVRPASSSNQRVLPVVAPTPAPEAPAPAPMKPPTFAATELPQDVSPVSGRLFERSDVDEQPKVATRVEPQLPGNLPPRPRNDIVVVRLLVSRNGHASRVSLLRGSMLGRTSNEAVVAAVTRWTFSPAKKRGEAVNCWYNVAVPLGHAD
jgi:hypothetical protein